MPLQGATDNDGMAAPSQEPQNSCADTHSTQLGFKTHSEHQPSSDLFQFNHHLQYLLGLVETQLQESHKLTSFLQTDIFTPLGLKQQPASRGTAMMPTNVPANKTSN